MNAEQREQVRDNAKYLRQVRPIDPGEIHEYVEGTPHPAAVRQVLRESATDLALVEDADGTFRPADEGPISVTFQGVERFPERYARVLEDRLVEAYGPGWPDGESGAAIRERIRRLKTDYLYGNPVEYDEETALGYALYHLPPYYAAIQYVLADLIADGLVGGHLRVLDVGAGVGGPALGICDLLPADALVEYHAVEPSAAADLLGRMLAETGRNVHPTVHRATAEAFDIPDREFDLVLFANVLSELADPAAVLRRYADALADDGTVVALAPADRNTTTNLRTVERAVENGLTVYAPTVRLWPDERPTDEGWSFDRKPDLAVPGFQKRLDENAGPTDDGTGEGAGDGPHTGPGTGDEPDDHERGEFVNVDVQYAYTVLRPDGKRRIDARADPGRHAKMAEMDRHVTDRIDLLAVKLSHDLADDDANPLFKVGDGSEQVAHYAVLTRESTLNRDLATADYGDLLAIENTLALWNEDERAYNLVVDDETVVDALPAGG